MKSGSNKEESERVFENPILHLLSKNHISVPLIIFFGSGIFLFAFGILNCYLSIQVSIIYFLIGFFLFTLLEYLVHRFLYHLPTVYQEGKIAFVLHGIHHKYPRDKKRLVMPPILSVAISAIILGIIYFLLGVNGFPFTGGFLFGYAAYLSVHYAVHAFKAPNNILKHLWINHSIHHYQNDEKAFGVSSPLWDYVFGTIPKKKDSSC